MRHMRGVLAGMLSVLLATMSIPGSAQVRQPAEVDRAKALIQAGNAEEAWQLLFPLQARYAGQPEFDLALAMAATDSGRPNLATFALERMLVAQPANPSVRLELARAYYALRDFERAQRELRFILAGNPPAEVRALVDEYRSRMQGLTKPLTPAGWSGYAEAGIGHDTNANAAAAQASGFIPGLGGELVLDSPARDGDNFAALAAGAQYAHALGGGRTLIAAGDVHGRRYAKLDEFDWRALDLRVGLHQPLSGGDTLQLTLHHADFELDGDDYRRTQSAAAQWSRRLGERARLTASAQGLRIRYRSRGARELSSDMLVAGAGGAYALPWAVLSGAVLGGIDEAVAGRPDGDRRLYGGNAALQRRLAERVESYVSLSVLRSDYRQQNLRSGVTRRDRQYDFAIGLSWEVADGWFLRPQVTRVRNRSNSGMNDYARTETSLVLRRTWE